MAAQLAAQLAAPDVLQRLLWWVRYDMGLYHLAHRHKTPLVGLVIKRWAKWPTLGWLADPNSALSIPVHGWVGRGRGWAVAGWANQPSLQRATGDCHGYQPTKCGSHRYRVGVLVHRWMGRRAAGRLGGRAWMCRLCAGSVVRRFERRFAQQAAAKLQPSSSVTCDSIG